MSRVVVAVFLLPLALFAAQPAAAESTSNLRVGSITIDARPLFDDADSERGGFYRVMNAMHFQTRARLIRSFLLFHEGEPFDAVKIEETERNLRLLPFLESVSIKVPPPHDGVVDVIVVTEDEFTSAVTGNFSNDGGKSVYDADYSQMDLFGSGSSVFFNFHHGVERRTNAVEYVNPRIFGPYWNLDLQIAKNSDGHQQRAEISRPLFSYTTPWALDAAVDELVQTERVYASGEVASRFQQRHRALALSRSHVLHHEPGRATAVVAGIDFFDDHFTPLPDHPQDLLPDERHFRFIDFGLESAGFRPRKLDYVTDSRLEDFNLATSASVHAAVAPHAWRFRGSVSTAWDLGPQTFALGQISSSIRGPSHHDAIVSADVRTVARFGTTHPQAFVTRARLDLGWQLDRDVQFFADGQNGLRAYPDFAFEGDRRIVLNAEHRVYLGRELLQLFSPGLAVFVDSGQAVTGRFHGMNTDFGVGLRLGIPRYNSALIRIDYAYALHASPLNRPGRVISFATSQAF